MVADGSWTDGCVLLVSQAEEAYKACLTHQEKHGAAHLALARLALASGQVGKSFGFRGYQLQ
jgi:hypothetical protein